MKGNGIMIERILRGMANYVNPRWLWFIAFVGLNLLQSAFTNWCPMITILKKCRVRRKF